ncbi:chaperonin 10-like protein [Phycomyces nitens]|nr:chaperonin 10-like protein [Phycomyces nitens]
MEEFKGYAGYEPFVLSDKNTHLKPFSYKPRVLEDDEVEILVSACGICGSDVHQLTNGWKRATYPLMPGHEFVGKVTAVGTQVKDLAIGDRVGVSPVCRSCGECNECKASYGQLCPNKVTTYNGVFKGAQSYGGYGNKVRIQSKWAVKVPSNIEDAECAPLLCAGITTYLPFKHQNINKDTSVGIVGIGGLGHLAIQWARAKECKRVLVVSSSKSKEEEAKKLGATDFATLDEIKTEPHLQSVDILLVCGSGKSTDWKDLLGLIKNHGKLLLLDIPDEPIPFPAGAFVYRHISIEGSFVGSHEDIKEMLEFASEKNVRPWIQKIGNSLDQVNQGLQDLMNGKAHYRIVITGEGRQ